MKVNAKRGGAILLAAALTLAACGTEEPADEPDTTPEAAEEPADAEEPVEEEPDEPDAAAESFYDGDTVRMIIPFGAGGGTDVNGRFLSEWFTRSMPEVTVQPENVPGGGGILGANEFELQTERDGMTIMLTASSNLINEQLGAAEVRYDTSNWTPVMGVPHGGVIYIREDLGLEEDLSNLDDIEFITAMRAPGGVDTLFLLAYELLGINYNPVFGYDGAGDTRIAVEQGESNLDWQTTGAYQTNVEPLIEAGTHRPFFSAGTREGDTVVRHEAHPDVPTVAEVYEDIHGEPPSGQLWEAYLEMNNVVFTSQRILWIHNDEPEGVVEEWRNAAIELADDQEFIDAAVENLGPYTILVGDALDAVAPDLRIAEENVDFIRDYLETEHGFVMD